MNGEGGGTGGGGWLAHLVRWRWLWWSGLLIWAAVLYFLSESSAAPPGPDLPYKDKVLHAGYFAGGSFTLCLALFGRRDRLQTLSAVMTGLCFGALIGALDEWHQTFTPGRSGNDAGDWAADISGGLIGALLAIQCLRIARGIQGSKAGAA